MLVYLTIIVIICSYAYMSLKPRSDFQIIQSQLCNVYDSVLYEKYPILLNDKLVNVEDLCGTLFKYQYVFKRVSVHSKNEIMKSYSKFVVLHNNTTVDTNITLSNPKGSQVNMIVPAYNVLIVPYLWGISGNDQGMDCIHLNDFMHFFFNIHLN
uniref:Uncharacterized protein n=1 Tax=Pyramimonas orientalis virus TaxID=455367 RepID=A0A7M3UNU3_POV01|nr:hypothetical protein HWQ62_00241 [Pyramimonas orientalis virus]